MTREEILQQGAPIEPNCFETDREEQWYKVGLYEGATASPWHSVADGDLPKIPKGDCESPAFLVAFGNGYMYPAYYEEDAMGDLVFYDVTESIICADYWMEIPQLPKESEVGNE